MIAYKIEGEEKRKTIVGNNIKCEGEITSKLVTKDGLIKNTENRPCGGARGVVKQARLNACSGVKGLIKNTENRPLPSFLPDLAFYGKIWLFHAQKWISLKNWVLCLTLWPLEILPKIAI